MKRRSLIIGGTRGAGRALAHKWAAEGRDVFSLSRKPPEGKLGPIMGVTYLQADLRDTAAVLKALEPALKPGLGDLVFFQRFRGEGDPWQGELDTTLSATKTIVEAASDVFAEDGAVVVVGTVINRFVVPDGSVGYHVAKAGLEALVRFFAVQLAPKGVRVNGVCPSTFEKEESREHFRSSKDLLDMYRQVIPLGRIGTTEELAEVITFLCGPQASYITGQNIVVDGGFSLIWQEALAKRLALKK